MKFIISILLTLLFGWVVLGDHTSGPNPGISVKVDRTYLGLLGTLKEVNITSKEDTVTVNSVVVDRGNCLVKFVKPVTLKFSEVLSLDVSKCQVMEISVETNLGTFSEKYRD